ncbi:MAG: twin-arginine translocase subunit TatC [Planctomycetes bacterium]|nr:twin-arginine translocase subunit TatC [Planctomycetota bacterium]
MSRKRQESDDRAGTVMSFGEHLEELRRRLFRCVLLITLGAAVAFYYQDEILEWVAGPHLRASRVISARAEAALIRDDCARLARVAATLPSETAALAWRQSEERAKATAEWESMRAARSAVASSGDELRTLDLVDARLRALERGTVGADLWSELCAGIESLGAALAAEASRQSGQAGGAIREAGANAAALRSRSESWKLHSARAGDPDWEPFRAFAADLTAARARVRRFAAGDLPATKLKLLGYPESVMAHMKVCIILGLLAAMPWIVFELWGFVASGLYRHERRAVYPFLPVSMLLLVAGALFGYYVLVPIGLGFLGSYGSPELLEASFTLQGYLSLLVVLLMGLGLLFQLPLVMLFLARAGMVSAATFRQYRKAAIIGSLIFAAVLTPPDVVSQLLLGIPTVILYEVGILVSTLAERRRDRNTATRSGTP